MGERYRFGKSGCQGCIFFCLHNVSQGQLWLSYSLAVVVLFPEWIRSREFLPPSTYTLFGKSVFRDVGRSPVGLVRREVPKHREFLLPSSSTIFMSSVKDLERPLGMKNQPMLLCVSISIN